MAADQSTADAAPAAAAASSHNKPCSVCATPRPVLVRCQIDESGKWNFVCPGKCWQSVSGGVEDARGHRAEFPHYRYGGMWIQKNRHADGPLNAKKPKKMKKRQKAVEAAAGEAAAGEGKDASDDENQAGTSA